MNRLLLLIILALTINCHILCASESSKNQLDKHERTAFTTGLTIVDLLGKKTAKLYAPIMPVDETIFWEMYLPVNYDSNKPAGLMIYISPSNSGKIPSKWKSLMDKYNLIWIGANESGNNKDTRRRMIYALLATAVVDRDYAVDNQRVYLSGFSGGGRVASMVSIEYPTIFKGAVYNNGVNFWGDKTPVLLNVIKNNSYVFISAKKDFNLKDTKQVFSEYKSAGIKKIKLIVNPTRGHSNPSKKDFDSAIVFLDRNKRKL